MAEKRQLEHQTINPCRKWGVKDFSLFDFILRNDFWPNSNIITGRQ